MQQIEKPLFTIRDLRAYELQADDMPALQRFFEANPLYFKIVNGSPAAASEALDVLKETPPAEWGFTKKWLLGFMDQSDNIVAMADVVSDLLAQGVWHIGLFIMATARHGSGDAQAVYAALESWAKQNGARWLRLGVVQGNVQAERFWARVGFIQVRTRTDVKLGHCVHTIRVMVKALDNGMMPESWTLVERDRPEI